MKNFKIVLGSILFISIIVLGSKAWVKYTHSFRVDKIKKKIDFSKKIEVQNDFDVFKILDQNFKFLNKGRQSFVFESQDGRYVLKLFRYHRYSLPFWTYYLKSFGLFKNHLSKMQKERSDSYDETIESYKLALDQLKEETGILYLHLNSDKNLHKKITILDKFNRKYELDLNQVGFILQKKTSLLIPSLYFLKDDIFAVKNMLSSFFTNIDSIYQKKIFNDDRHVLNNLGIAGGRVFEIDIGRFKYKENLLDKEIYEKEIYYYTEYLRKWLSKNVPQALPFFEIKLHELVESKKHE